MSTVNEVSRQVGLQL